MATVSNTLKLNDKMSSVFKSIIKSMELTLKTMGDLDRSAARSDFSKHFGSATRAIQDAAKEIEALEQDVEELSPAANRAASSFAGWQNPITTAAAAIYAVQKGISAITGVTSIADEFITTTSRLNMLNDGLQSTERLQDRIFRSAQQTRSSYQATADIVTQMGFAAGDAFGGNNRAMIRYSELLNKALAISGAEGAQRQSVLLQLSQAMARGTLQGQEFNAVMMNAPYIMQKLAEEMGVAQGELKQLGSDGKITTDVLLAAMFNAQNEIDALFQDMPDTVGDMMTKMGNNALNAFRPLMNRLSALINSEVGQGFVAKVEQATVRVVAGITWVIDKVEQAGAVVSSNWGIIGPILTGFAAIMGTIVAAVTLYNTVQGVAATVTAISTAASALKSGATLAEAAALKTATGAQVGLNAAMLANPVTWVIAAIVAIIAIVMRLWKTNIDFKYGVLGIWDSIMGFFKKVPLFFQWVGNGIADAFAASKVMALTILQGLANGAIDIINNLISLLNKIPGVAIDPIDRLTFAASAAAEAQAQKQARDQSLVDNANAVEAEIAAQRAQRAAEKAAEQAKLDAEGGPGKGAAEKALDYSEFGGNGAIDSIDHVGSVGRINDEVTISDKDIKLLKDLAAQDYQIAFTYLTPQLVAHMNIRETADKNEILEFVEDSVAEALSSSLVVH